MSLQFGPMKAILSAMVAAALLLSACGSDANTPEEAVAEFTAAFGNNDVDLAWSFIADKCKGGISEAPDDYRDLVAGWSATYPGATASNITAVVDGDRAALTYDVYDGAGEFAEEYIAQPWVLSDGNWYREPC